MAKKILVVDDDEELCYELTEILKEEGFDTRCAFDGIEGKKEIEKYDYDLLILDYKMSGLNGIEILKSLKKKEPKCKFFFITGKPHIEKSLREEGLAHLVDGIMQKPFDVKALLEKIKASLSPYPK